MKTEEFAIITENLTREFGGRVAVDKLNIAIRQGEIFSLLGTNGAGKTTSIRMLCCLLQPTSGTARVNGFSVSDAPQKIKEIIGVSPQETAVAGHLNSKENLMLMGGVSGLSRDASKKRAKILMELLEIEDRKDQARKLSGGLQRRLSIAMALMPDPKILFLDEPTLGLDPHARKSVWTYIEKLKEEKTVLLTTHYLEEADSLADTIAIMDRGRIIENGTAAELKQKYNSTQVLKISAENLTHEIIKLLADRGLDAKIVKNVLEIAAHHPDIYMVIDILKSMNVKISGFEMKEPTLNEVFIKLTGKEETA